MSCLSAIFRRLFGDTAIKCKNVGGDLSLQCRKISDFSVRCGIVCSTSLGLGVLWSSEGLILSNEGGRFILRRITNG